MIDDCLIGIALFKHVDKQIRFDKNLQVDVIDAVICMMMSDQVADTVDKISLIATVL